MNLYLFSIIGKFLKFTFVSLVSVFNTSLLETNVNQNINNTLNNDSNVYATLINYDTSYVYNSSIPTGQTNILENGVNGIYYNNTSIVQDKTDEVIEIGTGLPGEYSGRLTGYGPDCPGCSEYGYVSCPTYDKQKYSLKTDGIYYDDLKYGKVRILASSNYFPCGTIIEVKRDNSKFLAVVLDRGYDMNNAWKNGIIWFDLAYESQATVMGDLNHLGYNFDFLVKRWGW